MQSIFRLPWCSEQITPKFPDRPSIDRGRSVPTVDFPVLAKFKRKHSDTPEHSNKRQRSSNTVVQLPPIVTSVAPAKIASKYAVAPAFQVTSSVPTAAPNSEKTLTQPSLFHDDKPSSAPASAITETSPGISAGAPAEATAPLPALDNAAMTARLRQTIENEFNMQILLKHDELRLIEQELAKCQVALEQLRRCELRPMRGEDGLDVDLSSGLGPSKEPLPGHTRPRNPAPYGVADGPYTRHYQQWLLHDSQFDSTLEQPFGGIESSTLAGGRSTRNNGYARHVAAKSMAFPARPVDPLQSLPTYPAAPPRDKSAPLVLKRSTDNQLVKLICNTCQRGNFSSIQGFLNHCRIAHKVDLKSHDEAAIKCGQPLDDADMAQLATGATNTPVSKPAPIRPVPFTTAPVSTTSRNFVHPLNTKNAAPAFVGSSQNTTASARAAIPSLNTLATSIPNTPFTPSSEVPRLSAHFAKHRLGGDLAKATAKARQVIDLETDDYLSSPDVQEPNSPFDPTEVGASRTIFGNNRMGPTSDVEGASNSRKVWRQPSNQRSRPPPLAQTGLRPGTETPTHLDHGASSPLPQTPMFSPDGNPGLVSDHDDEDDQGSASDEEEVPHDAESIRPALAVGRTCADNMDLDVDEGHVMDRSSGVYIRRNSIAGVEERVLQNASRTTAKKFDGEK